MIQPKVSVIIPVYNAAKFLDDCVQSLLKQTLKECEFIFVNDGSTDNSLQIVQQYSLKDERIIVIDQENKGISIARNNGIEIATGAYIGFMDNDDFLKEDMFECLYKATIEQDLDIVVSKTLLGRDGKFIDKEALFPTDIVYNSSFINSDIIPSLLKVEDLFAVWNKIYKRDLVFSNHVRFPSNRAIEEDNMFNIQAFHHSKKVMFIEYGGYYYREVATSESRKLIEQDYFSKALEKYYFDYKKEFNLEISVSEMEKLKSIRLMHKVFFYTYKCGIDKIKLSDKYNYIKKMILHPTVHAISIEYKKDVLKDKGKFERLVLSIIKNKSAVQLYLLLFLLQTCYHPKISEIVRYFNNPDLKKPTVIKN